MSLVHVFISTGRFRGFADMRAFIDQTSTNDGDGIPSPFMREIELEGYELGCIEAIHSERVVPLATLLAGASYATQWVGRLSGDLLADAAICVFEPNVVARPTESSLTYVGAFEWHPVPRFNP